MLKGQSFGRQSDGIRDAESSGWFRRAPDRPRGGFGEGPCRGRRVLFEAVRLAAAAVLAGTGWGPGAGGPTAALRANVPAGLPGMVPYIGAPDVAAML